MALARVEFLAGMKAELPILIGVIPFGMIYGVLALSAGIPPLPAQAMSMIVFAGSAQILVTQLVNTGAPWVVVVLSVAVVNLRHALYSASIAPFLKRLNPAWKCLLAYLLTDEAYAVSIIQYQKEAEESSVSHSGNQHWFFLGAGLALWASWQASTAVGILLGAVIPSNWSLDFTLALTFIALVVPSLKDPASLAAALIAGIVAILGHAWPYKLGLLLAALTGILAAVAYELIWQKFQGASQ